MQGVPGGTGQKAQGHTFQTSSEVSIVADATNNSILVRSNAKDYKKILDALKQLDILPLQVLVEATVIEVTLAGSLQCEIQWKMFAYASNGYKSGFRLTDRNNTAAIGTTTDTTTTPGTTTQVATTAANALANVLYTRLI